ncbi:MAG: 1-deoxy-D-xylulose-5-phosphate reductoisomerase [Bacteroidetes bacterium 4572_112]|nr:MAG: 1-deoxy-D-xylulose-5-phosphate reductoisomerase [Bacteroidetes bacterium 4572_112]
MQNIQEENQRKRIAILGSTGSIGTQALEVVSEHEHMFEVEVLTAGNNVDLLIQQCLKYKPNVAVIENEDLYARLQDALQNEDIQIYAGKKAIDQVVEMGSIDMVLMAIVGFAALAPTLNAIEHKKQIAIANKETFVVAGEIVTRKAMENGVNLYPVDSEHSAIFQCLVGEFHNPIEKIILTASGGPFRGKDIDFLRTVKPKDALKHPNWDMGAKITIDSASMMNKGLEVIEAKWLFGVKTSQIDVLVHPQSIVHSMVQFEDGSIKAQLGLPDMKLPIQYAMAYPQRVKNNFPRLDFKDFSKLTFESADMQNFRNLALAFEALEKGGNMAAILNAANEVAVSAFLKEKVGFVQMSELIEKCMNKVSFIAKPTYNDLLQTDIEARKCFNSFI